MDVAGLDGRHAVRRLHLLAAADQHHSQHDRANEKNTANNANNHACRFKLERGAQARMRRAVVGSHDGGGAGSRRESARHAEHSAGSARTHTRTTVHV